MVGTNRRKALRLRTGITLRGVDFYFLLVYFTCIEYIPFLYLRFYGCLFKLLGLGGAGGRWGFWDRLYCNEFASH